MPSRRDFLAALPAAAFAAPAAALAAKDGRLQSSSRLPERAGWIPLRLEGSPSEIGFQHGFHLAREIETAHRTIRFEMERDTSKPWSFFKKAAREIFWPKVEDEYRAELEGIVAGMSARGGKFDLWDITAHNAWLEWTPYFTNWYDRKHTSAPTADRCSAFVATGSYTRDGRPVIGHNAWTGYANGVYWNILFDIRPAKGHRIFMDGYPGLIHSGDDFGINAAGLVITETTISQFDGFDPDGIPEFMRARKAMQYASTIDEFARIMKHGNNGGYANNWLVAEMRSGEIGSLELGLKHVTLERSRDGYFCGANFPVNPALAREETLFDTKDPSLSPNARRKRWEQLMAEFRGRIDAAAGQRFLADHYDAHAGTEDANERTLCGHIDLSPRGVKAWQPEFGAAGAVQNKVTTAKMAESFTLSAAIGHACGRHFRATDHLRRHPQFAWQKPYLKDLPAQPWTVFSAS